MISFGPPHYIIGSAPCSIFMLSWLYTYCKPTNSIRIGNAMQHIIMCVFLTRLDYAAHAVQVLGLTATPAVDSSLVSSVKSFWPCCLKTADWLVSDCSCIVMHVKHRNIHGTVTSSLMSQEVHANCKLMHTNAAS